MAITTLLVSINYFLLNYSQQGVFTHLLGQFALTPLYEGHKVDRDTGPSTILQKRSTFLPITKYC